MSRSNARIRTLCTGSSIAAVRTTSSPGCSDRALTEISISSAAPPAAHRTATNEEIPANLARRIVPLYGLRQLGNQRRVGPAGVGRAQGSAGKVEARQTRAPSVLNEPSYT